MNNFIFKYNLLFCDYSRRHMVENWWKFSFGILKYSKTALTEWMYKALKIFNIKDCRDKTTPTGSSFVLDSYFAVVAPNSLTMRWHSPSALAKCIYQGMVCLFLHGSKKGLGLLESPEASFQVLYVWLAEITIKSKNKIHTCTHIRVHELVRW